MKYEIFNTRDLPRDKGPWPDRFVQWYIHRDPTEIEDFRRVIDGARDERPIQDFLEKRPHILALAFPVHCCWIFPRPRLGGGKYIPDFLLCDLCSLGYQWALIELESPTAEATNKGGSVSGACHHALEQIRDYRRWLRDNALFEKGQGFEGLNADCSAWITIGRRNRERTDIEQQRLADYGRERIEVASYDRLLVEAREHLLHINSLGARDAELKDLAPPQCQSDREES